MKIKIYSDESGTFDRNHYDYFVISGLIVLGDKQDSQLKNTYNQIEQNIRVDIPSGEIKGYMLPMDKKNNIVNKISCYKYSIIFTLKEINKDLFKDKKDKQRYLNYAHKRAIIKTLSQLIKEKKINPNEIEQIDIYMDDHDESIDSKADIKESLEQIFIRGTYNNDFSIHYPPMFPHANGVGVIYLKSDKAKNKMIRAADMTANLVYNRLQEKKGIKKIKKIPKMFVERNSVTF